MEYTDTRMIEPEEEEYFSTTDKIMKLSDKLSEEIILENIGKQLEDKVTGTYDKLNYVSLFREKYSEIDPDDDAYDKDYLYDSLARITKVVGDGLKARYEVEIGSGLDYTTPSEYLMDYETLYEFLLIRQYDNIIDYLNFKIRKERKQFLDKYSPMMEEDEHAKDLFVVQSKKKFKNNDDITILHFMNEIIDDICEETTSGYVLFDTIVNLDLFEEYNNKMSELLLNYGKKIVLNNDSKTAKLYLAPLSDPDQRDSIRTDVWSQYLEGCELLDD